MLCACSTDIFSDLENIYVLFKKYALLVFHSSQHYNPHGPPATSFATNTNSARPRHLKDIFSFTLIICDHLLSAPRATLSRTIHAPHVAPSRDIFEIKFTREDNLVQKNFQAFSLSVNVSISCSIAI
jgi:hypothetical protein